jgi:hypothetical protein
MRIERVRIFAILCFGKGCQSDAILARPSVNEIPLNQSKKTDRLK